MGRLGCPVPCPQLAQGRDPDGTNLGGGGEAWCLVKCQASLTKTESEGGVDTEGGKGICAGPRH